MTRRNHETRSRDDATTDRTTPTDRKPTTMGEISHTHPYSDHGAVTRPFQRGPVVAADGGRRDAREEEDDEEAAEKTRMKDIDHTPPVGDGVDRVFERGNEQTATEAEEAEAAEYGEPEEPVVSEE